LLGTNASVSDWRRRIVEPDHCQASLPIDQKNRRLLLVVTVLMTFDDPLPQRRLSIEWLTVLVEGHLGSDPTHL
jgi:hypothetical protein